jgi:catechol 2,3-dioxygenase-like lactoylglutathione lyase family enzyme
MISGAHIIIYSTNADADRAFFRDILGLASVDVGDGWLIFALPPSEVAVHPAEKDDVHELFLTCDDIDAFVAQITDLGVEASAVETQTWGLLTHVSLPGGGKLGVYEPTHAQPG